MILSMIKITVNILQFYKYSLDNFLMIGSFYQPADSAGQLEILERDIEYAKVHTQVGSAFYVTLTIHFRVVSSIFLLTLLTTAIQDKPVSSSERKLGKNFFFSKSIFCSNRKRQKRAN